MRKRLTMNEIREKVKALEKLGHKRLMIDMGRTRSPRRSSTCSRR